MPAQSKVDNSYQQLEKAATTTAKGGMSAGRVAFSVLASPVAAAATFALGCANITLKIIHSLIQPIPFPGFIKSEVSKRLKNWSEKAERNFWKPMKLLLGNAKTGGSFFFPKRDEKEITQGDTKDAEISDDEVEEIQPTAPEQQQENDTVNFQRDPAYTQWAEEYANEKRERERNSQGGGRE